MNLPVHVILGIRASPHLFWRAGGRIPRVAWTTIIVAETDEEKVKAFVAGHSGWVNLI
jgi:hypothetical protein